MKKFLLWLALSVVMPQFLNAQNIELVKDINVTGSRFGLLIYQTASANGKLFFLGSDGINGAQLWTSDGTEAGTVVLTNLNAEGETPPSDLTSANGAVYFEARYDGAFWLFKSDGTRQGTLPLHRLGAGYYCDNSILGINGVVYFIGGEDNGDYQLWKTDGTAGGTVLVKDVGRNASNFFNFNGLLAFFVRGVDSSNPGFQLWKSNGTAAGTTAGATVTSLIRPAVTNGFIYFSEGNALKRTDGTTVTTIKQGFANVQDPVAVGSTIYFSAQEGTTGSELWKSDGTTAGTVLVKDINPGTDVSSSPTRLINVNGTLFFAAIYPGGSTGLWKSNGTAAGTVLVRDLGLGSSSDVREMIAVGNQAVFVSEQYIISGDYSEVKLWKSDGTSSGTVVLTNAGASNIINVNGTVFFVSEYQIYKSNLTPQGTVAVTDFSGPGSGPTEFFNLNGTGYFVANDGINGYELWKTNGTSSGTVLVRDINPGSAGSDPRQLTNVNGTLFFVANGKQIWKSNGTAAGTVLVKEMTTSSSNSIKGLINLNGMLFYGVVNGSDLQLWKSDGTTAGTVLITALPGGNDFAPVVFKGQLYFGAGENDGDELWKTDGTASGTSLVKDLPGSSYYLNRPNGLIASGNYLYYTTSSNGNFSLVRSDGTAAGTIVIKDIYTDTLFDFTGFSKAGNYVYLSFLPYDSGGIEPLWRTDGTTGGTIQVGEFSGDEAEQYTRIRHQTDVGGKLFFVPWDKEKGNQLWVSDGTPAGTRMVKQIGDVADLARISQSAAIGNIFYFSAVDNEHGSELWRSDGTSAGTYLIQDFNPNGGTRFYDLMNLNGTLLISADNHTIGAELYKYQPVPTGPAALRINSGGASFAASGSRPFSADQYLSGTTQISNAGSGDITGTSDDQLYKEQRYGSSFSYSIPVTNGQVSVVLHFAEIYWGVPGRGGSAGAAKRRFHVDIEGSRKLTNYDIFTAAGGAMRARTETFAVNVTDGTLNINFLSGAVDKPIIAAIEVLPTQQVTLGPIADAYIRNVPNDATNYGTATTLEVKTGSLPSYQRNTYLKFPLAGVSQVSSAKLRLYGSNIQNSTAVSLSAYGVSNDSWTETGITWQNAPAGSGAALGTVNVNNTAQYYEIDVTAFVQSQLAGDKTVSLFVTDPANQNIQLNFNSRENAANKPQLVITTTSPAARMGAENEIPEVAMQAEENASLIYPNPVGRQFTVKVSNKHEGNVDLQLVNQTGQSFRLQAKPGNAASSVDVDVSEMHLSSGIYLLRIESKLHHEVIKMFVAE